MRKITFILFLLLSLDNVAQPSTEVYLFDLEINGNRIKISNPLNISNNPGKYDNQPAFLLDGSSIIFSSTRNDQTDIRKYNISDNSSTWLTETPGSEYSPTPIPDGESISCILLEQNGRQLLWRYPLSGGSGEILIPYLKIGYHTWFNGNSLYAFVLGPHNTFQEIDIQANKAEIIKENIGRSLHKVPGKNLVSYIDKSSSDWMLNTYDPLSDESSTLVQTPENSEDMVWLNSNLILIGEGTKILLWEKNSLDEWKLIVDLMEFGLGGITRLAVSPEKTSLAIVVSEVPTEE